MLDSEPALRIRQAFVSLLADKPYEKVSFTELSKESGMSRQNLYNYYSSKEELVKDIIEDLFELMFREVEALPLDIDLEATHNFVVNICKMTQANKYVSKALLTNTFDDILFANFVVFIKRSFGHIIRTRSLVLKDNEHLHYLSLQFAGAAFHSAQEWVRNDMTWPVEKYAQMLSTTMLNTVELLIETCEAA